MKFELNYNLKYLKYVFFGLAICLGIIISKNLAPYSANAIAILDGDTIKTSSNPDVYIVKLINQKRFRRLILNPQVFKSYGHLSWSKIKIVSQSEMDSYKISDIVRAENDLKVYQLVPNGDIGVKHWLNISASNFTSLGYDWDSIYTINTVDKNNYATGADITSLSIATIGCGNNKKESGEICDGYDLAGATCFSRKGNGYAGTLSCASNCQSFNTSACYQTANADTYSPTTPTNLVATSISSSQIALTWKISTDNIGVAGYHIYRNGIFIVNSSVNTYTDNALNPHTAYFYRVAAYDAAGNVSVQSNEISITTLSSSTPTPIPTPTPTSTADTFAPSTPNNLTATVISSSQVNLAWSVSTDNVGVAGYKIYRNNSQISTVASNFYSDVGLSASTTYAYKISAYDAAGNISAQSVPVSATTLGSSGTLAGKYVFPLGDTRLSNVVMYPVAGTAPHRGGLGTATFNGAKIDLRFNMVPVSPTDISVGNGNQNAVGSKIPALAYDQIFNVSPSGSDATGDGSAGKPYKTINKVLSLSAFGPGDTVLLHAGTYNEGEISNWKSGTQASPITIKSAGDGEVIIDSTPAGSVAYTIKAYAKNYLIFDGLTLKISPTAQGGNQVAIYLAGNSNIIRNSKFISSGDVRVYFAIISGSDNKIFDNDFSGNVYTQPISIDGNSNEFRRNTVHDVTNGREAILRLAGENNLTANNIFYNIEKMGPLHVVMLYHAYNSIVINNLFYNIMTTTANDPGSYQMILPERANNSYIVGNTFIGTNSNGTAAIYLGSSINDVVSNNIFYGFTNKAIYVYASLHPFWYFGNIGTQPVSSLGQSTDQHFIISNNLFYNNADNGIDFTIYSTNIIGSASPFANESSKDFTIVNASSAKDGGMIGASVPVGGGSRVDIGAFEYGVSPWTSWNGSKWIFNSGYQYQRQLQTSDNTPTFAWVFHDSDNDYGGGDSNSNPTVHIQSGFRAQIDTAPTFDSVNLIDSGYVSSAMSAWTSPVALSAGKYYFRVQTTDNIEPVYLSGGNPAYGTWSINGFVFEITN